MASRTWIAFIVLVVLIVSLSFSVYASIKPKNVQVYYFYTPACPHCQRFNPIWDEVTAQSNVDSIKVDASDPANANLVSKYAVLGVPTIIKVTRKGSTRFSLPRTKENLEAFLR